VRVRDPAACARVHAPTPYETEHSAIALLRAAAAAFPFQLTHVPTDNGSCFTAAFAKACSELGANCRHAPPRMPQTNGLEAALPLLPPGDRFAMVERFNSRIASEVLGINISSHRALEQLPRGFNSAINACRQLVLDGRAPN